MLSLQSAPPPWGVLWKEQDAIIGTAAGDSLGWAVALSADEMTLVVGAPGITHDDKKRGYVEVYYMLRRSEYLYSYRRIDIGIRDNNIL